MSLSRLAIVLFCLIGSCLYFNRANDVRLVHSNGDYAYEGYQIESLEPFELKGRVLSRKNYSSGREAELSPTDLAMGWGEMQDREHVKALEVSQRNRWFYWKAERLPIPKPRLTSQMSNIHIIPANRRVAAALQDLKADSLVHLQGALVAVEGADGWRWRSSLSRTDTGAGACELMWLERLSVLD